MARLDQALAELNQRLGGLPGPKEAQMIWGDIWHQEAHHSTALEGNTLVLREVQALLGGVGFVRARRAGRLELGRRSGAFINAVMG